MDSTLYFSNTTGTTRRVNVILPQNYTSTKKYPVLYLLHGIGGNENEWLNGNPEKIIYKDGNSKATEMIIVMPNIRANRIDYAEHYNMYSLEHYKVFDNFINDLRNDLIPFINHNYSVAIGRESTAIAGLSMGGREALYIGFTLPEVFGHIGAFCPAPGIMPYTFNNVTEKGLFSKNTFKLPEKYNKKTTVLITSGAKDRVVGNTPELYHNVLTKNGTEHAYVVRPGGHDFNVWSESLTLFTKRIFQ